MKVLHLSWYFLPEYSGTTTRLYNILSHLPCSVYALVSNKTMKGKTIALKQEQFKNIFVERISISLPPILDKIAPLHYVYVIWRQPKIIYTAASRKECDIIHVHDAFACKQAGYHLSKNLGKPLIVEFHGVSQEYSQGITKGLKNNYMATSDQKIINFCRHVITLTNSLKQWLSDTYKIPKEKITVVPNGVDVKNFTASGEYKEKANKMKQELGISEKVILYAGYMDKINGIPFLAKAVHQVIRKRRDACFVFIGHGPEEEKLKSLSREYPQNVKFLPMVPYEEMPVCYEMCDIFVIPRPSTISTETLNPLKLLEAMAMEKPVLGSNVGGITEVIKHGENGYLFEKGNMESFTKMLLEVLDADNRKIGRNARRTVVENYTWDKSAKILQQVYEELV